MALREGIGKRTQAKGEPVTNYLACINGLFSRTDPRWPEPECVRYAHRNMLPAYRLVIPITAYLTMERLENQAALQEGAFNSAHDYRPPPNPEDSLCPAFAYAAPASKPSYNRHSRPTEALRSVQCEDGDPEELPTEMLEAILNKRRSAGSNNYKQANTPKTASATELGKFPEPLASAVTTPSTPRVEAKEALCWNCEKAGHMHRSCTAPRRRFCYGCRLSGVTTKTCPHCNKGKAAG